MAARLAMTIAHRHGLAGHDERNGAAEAAAFVGLLHGVLGERESRCRPGRYYSRHARKCLPPFGLTRPLAVKTTVNSVTELAGLATIAAPLKTPTSRCSYVICATLDTACRRRWPLRWSWRWHRLDCRRPASPAGRPRNPQRSRTTGSRRSSSSAAASSSSARPRPRARAPSAAPTCSCGRCCAWPSCSRPCRAWSPCSIRAAARPTSISCAASTSITAPTSRRFVDGVPMNLRSHGHGQGYLDVNGMMPETVERIDYRKGPYRADVGDFSMAGAAFITTIERLDAPFLALEGGENGWGRLAGGGTKELGDGASLTGIDRAQDLRRAVGAARGPRAHFGLGQVLAADGVRHAGRDRCRVTTRTGCPTEQIPERAIGTAVCEDAFCALDPTAEGDTKRWIFGAQMDGAVWRASAYAQYYDWYMTVEPDLRLPDQSVRQALDDGRPLRDARWSRPTRSRSTSAAEFRYDDISNVGVDEFDGGALRRQHRPEQHHGNLARRVHGGIVARRPTICA